MLLNNLSKFDSVISKLLPLEEQPSKGTQMLDNLLEIFVQGETAKFNKEASFHFLAGVFANISSSPQGCMHFLKNSTVDDTPRLSKLIVFTEHPSLIRRGGAISTLKNVCFGVSLEKKGLDVLLEESLNLFVYILLPLSGPEDYDDEVFLLLTKDLEGMPDELQLLEDDKKREVDPQLRVMLVEILVALAAEKETRDHMRKIQVYQIIKKLHIQERNEDVQEIIETLVNLLMREDHVETIDEVEE
jgi:hypothetical protein